MKTFSFFLVFRLHHIIVTVHFIIHILHQVKMKSGTKEGRKIYVGQALTKWDCPTQSGTVGHTNYA